MWKYNFKFSVDWVEDIFFSLTNYMCLMLIALDISGPAEAKVGQEISLVCNATTDSLGDDNITWLKNGQMLRTSSRITMSRDINIEEQRIYSKLYIRDMKIGDKGTYTCKTKNFLLKSHSLSILELPGKSKTIMNSTSILIICNITFLCYSARNM